MPPELTDSEVETLNQRCLEGSASPDEQIQLAFWLWRLVYLHLIDTRPDEQRRRASAAARSCGGRGALGTRATAAAPSWRRC